MNRKVYVRAGWLGGGVLAIIGLGWSLLPSQVPLFYSRPWGEERLASKIYLVLLPGLGMGLAGLNWWISRKIEEEEVFLKKLLGGISWLVMIMLGFASVSIIWVMI